MAERDHLGVTISGLDELAKSLDELGKIGKRDAFKASLRKALKPMAATANSLAPVGSDPKPPNKRLRGSFVVRTALSRAQARKRGPKRYPVEVFVGSTRPHAHLIEFGHRLVKGRTRRGTITSRRIIRDKKGRIRTTIYDRKDNARAGLQIGNVRAIPMLRPAFDAHAKQAVRDFLGGIRREMRRVVARYTRQAERGKLSRGAKLAFKVDL